MTTKEEFKREAQKDKWLSFEPDKVYFYIEMATDKMIDGLGGDETIRDRVKDIATWIIPPKYRIDAPLGQRGTGIKVNPTYAFLPPHPHGSDPLGQVGHYLFKYEPKGLDPSVLQTKLSMCDTAFEGLRRHAFLPYTFLLVI